MKRKNDIKVPKNDVKKTQDMIILITKIFSVSFFLVGLVIIIITAIIRSKTPIGDDVIEYESVSDNFYLYQEDKKILENEYLVLKNIDDFNNFNNLIEKWYIDSFTNYTNIINSVEFFDEERKQDDISSYKQFNDQRYIDIKKLVSGAKINESTFSDKAIIVVEDITDSAILSSSSLVDLCLNEGSLTVYINKDIYGVVGDASSTLYFIELDKSYVENNIVINVSTVNSNHGDPNVSYKPIIYIYPDKEMDVNVKLLYKELLTVSYPKYENGWNIYAYENGTLIDKNTNRELYALYYESNNSVKFKVEEDGFVVRGSDAASFLEEKLEILGLNSREINEFIIYWLPQLESNKFNYIRFATSEEINQNMPLVIEPKPDNIIRVLMTFKGLDSEIEVLEQQLTRVKRKGYSVVEWGGTIIE